ncbi:hypothetical protein ACTFIY_009456 [Dictyostelium cf. discoideum]
MQTKPQRSLQQTHHCGSRHRHILQKRNSDFIIKAVKNQHGESISDQKAIEEEYLNFYTNLYNAKIDDPMIHHEKWNKLDEDFSATEILHVIKQLNPNKSPGPDASAFNDALKNPHLINDDYKEGLIITIPKKGDPELIKNRRPITLANYYQQ